MFANDPDIFIGTSSWSSKDWVGIFYPKGLKPADFIESYATRYDTVEIDATFYRTPTVTNVASWRRRTPKGFTFAVKAPRVITHEKVLVDAEDDMGHFLEVISGLDDRLGPILLQFPYFNKKVFSSKAPFFERLDNFLSQLPNQFRFAVELRNKNWLRQDLHEICTRHRVALAWVDQAWMPGPSQWFEITGGPTTDFAYIRWLGDRKQIEKLTTSWDRTMIDRRSSVEQWVPVVSALRREQIRIYGYFNNHFAGHAPNSIELFRDLYR
jgi:uncharacterized protein YecE (DUF72 family)